MEVLINTIKFCSLIEQTFLTYEYVLWLQNLKLHKKLFAYCWMGGAQHLLLPALVRL